MKAQQDESTATAGASVGESPDRRPSRVVPATASGRLFVIGVLVVALAVRIALAVHVSASYRPLTDALDFDRLASSLASGHGWPRTALPGAVGPTAFRAPLYPLALTVVYWVFGAHRYTAGLLANAVGGTVVVALIGVVARQLWGLRVAAVALAVAAVHPTLVLFGTSLQLEPLLEALMLGSLAAALQHRRSQKGVGWALGCGVLAGLAILTREVGLAVLFPVCWLVWTSRQRFGKHAVLAPAVTLAAAVAVVAPWTIRNAVTLRSFAPVSTSGGVALAGVDNATSFHNKATPAQWVPPWMDPSMARVMTARAEPSEAQLDRDLRGAALTFLRAHPTYLGTTVVSNTIGLFDLRGTRDALFSGRFTPYPIRLTKVSVYATYVLDVLVLTGLALGAARRVTPVIWLIPLLAWMGIVVVSGSIRYRGSIEPFTVLLAAASLVTIYDRISTDRMASLIHSTGGS